MQNVSNPKSILEVHITAHRRVASNFGWRTQRTLWSRDEGRPQPAAGTVIGQALETLDASRGAGVIKMLATLQ